MREFATVTSTGSSAAFELTAFDLKGVIISMKGTFNSATIKLQAATSATGTQADVNADGTLAEFTADDNEWIMRRYTLPAGYYSFEGTGAGVTSVVIYVDGQYVNF